MDGHSKNVVLIGVLNILGYIMLPLSPLTRAVKLLNAGDCDVKELSFYFALVGYSVLIVILAGLMICGVLKKRHVLLSPFLVVNSVVFMATVVVFFSHFLLDVGTYLYYVEDCLYAIGVQIIIMYPIYTLFVKLRSQYMKRKSVETDSFQYDKKTENTTNKVLCGIA